MTTLGAGFVFICEVYQPGRVKNGFGEVVKNDQAQSDPCEVGHVSQCDEREIGSGELNTMWYFFFFDFLKVQFRIAVQPVWQLNDVEKFKQKRHFRMRISLPKRRYIQYVIFSGNKKFNILNWKKIFFFLKLLKNDVCTPDDGNKIKHYQLSRFVKQTVLNFRQMHLSTDFLEKEGNRLISNIYS